MNFDILINCSVQTESPQPLKREYKEEEDKEREREMSGPREAQRECRNE